MGYEEISERIHEANIAFDKRYPGESDSRQPVHTLYGGAHLFKADTPRKMGRIALSAMETGGLGQALGISEEVCARVRQKLENEPVEDFRIDFEDGYGVRASEEEDSHARSAASELAAAMAAGAAPPFTGIRIKPFTEASRERAFRTLDLFLDTLAERTGGKVPQHFAVTLPKVTVPEQTAAITEMFDIIEFRLDLPPGSLTLEIMVETPQALLDLRNFVSTVQGRCSSAHFGPYDYSSACGITAEQQRLEHPVCDMARHMLQASVAGTGIRVSDGPVNILPVGDAESIRRGWKLHFASVRRALSHGFYQGWDLHPAQLPSRFAAVYSFFEEGLQPSAERLRNFVARSAQASLVGQVFDDAATGRGLVNYFRRAINCGAITKEQAIALTGYESL